jgi:hypothetical protein
MGRRFFDLSVGFYRTRKRLKKQPARPNRGAFGPLGGGNYAQVYIVSAFAACPYGVFCEI